MFAHAKSEAFFNLQRTSTLYIWNINLSSSQVEISDSVDRAHYSEASFFRPLLSPPLDREMALFSIPFSLESRFLFPSSPIKVNGRPPRFVCSLSLPLSDQLIALPNDRGFCSQTRRAAHRLIATKMIRLVAEWRGEWSLSGAGGWMEIPSYQRSDFWDFLARIQQSSPNGSRHSHKTETLYTGHKLVVWSCILEASSSGIKSHNLELSPFSSCFYRLTLFR